MNSKVKPTEEVAIALEVTCSLNRSNIVYISLYSAGRAELAP